MAKLEDINELLSRIDHATDAIAKKLKDLADALAAGGLTAAEEEGVIAALRTEADKLEGLAKDPENPIPEVPAEPGEGSAPGAEPTPEPSPSPVPPATEPGTEPKS